MLSFFKRNRFIAYILLAVLFVSSLPLFAIRAATPITVTINGEQVNFEKAPQVVNDRVMVQIRAIAEKLGCGVEWDNNTQTSYINQPGIPLQRNAVKGNDIQVYVNNQPVIFPDQKPLLIDDYVMIPSRGVIEALGYSVIWDDASQTQAISTSGQATPPVSTNYQQITFNGISFEYDSKQEFQNVSAEQVMVVYGNDTAAINFNYVNSGGSVLSASQLEDGLKSAIGNINAINPTYKPYTATNFSGYMSDFKYEDDGNLDDGSMFIFQSGSYVYMVSFLSIDGSYRNDYTRLLNSIKAHASAPAPSAPTAAPTPTRAPAPTFTPTPQPQNLSTVYWVPNGKSYHSTDGCSTLSRSRDIRSGTLAQAKAAGKTDPCDRCVRQ